MQNSFFHSIPRPRNMTFYSLVEQVEAIFVNIRLKDTVI